MASGQETRKTLPTYKGTLIRIKLVVESKSKEFEEEG